jgi:hypothetical protein
MFEKLPIHIHTSTKKLTGKKTEVFFLLLIVLFSVSARIFSFGVITIIFLSSLVMILLLDLYDFVNDTAKKTAKNENIQEFSWGFVREKTDYVNLTAFLSLIKKQNSNILQNYVESRLLFLLTGMFIFGDFIVAFKNLSFSDSGIYMMFSFFSKVLFIFFFSLKRELQLLPESSLSQKENLIDIYYKWVNTALPVSMVIFIAFFLLSRHIVDIFFGNSFSGYHTSLPFVFLANIVLLVALATYFISNHIDQVLTMKVLKIFGIVFAVLFVFMPINYIDTITYFIVGMGSLVSIFLYNLVIKKPLYISHTYNHFL